MQRRYAHATAALFCLIAGGATAEKPAPLTDDGAFRVAYAMSYYGFDVCGDAADGLLYRRALAEKVEQCPFTADAKADFRQWSASADAKGRADVQRYIAEHDKLPESLDEKKMQCRKEQATPAYRQTVALLADYAKGAVKFDAVVPDACDIKAGTP